MPYFYLPTIIKERNVADLTTIISLTAGISACFLIIAHQAEWAIIFIAIAFYLDFLDGYLARKIGISSDFGKQLDSFADIINYLIFSGLFIQQFLNFNNLIALLSVAIMIICGALRLARFNLNGLTEIKKEKYHQGLIVPYINLVIISLYFLSIYLNQKIVFLCPIIVIIISWLMISDLKMKKIKNHLIPITIAAFFICLSIIRLTS